MSPAMLLAVQRSAGNRAAVALRGTSAPPTAMPTPAPMLQRQVAVGGSLSPTAGGTIEFGLPKASKRVSYITVANPRVSVSVKPTAANEFALRPEGTDATAGLGGAKSATKHSTAAPGKDAGTTSGGPTGSKITAAIKHKYGNALFTDAEGAVGTDGGSIGLNAGGEWQNFTMSVKFTLFAMGNEGKDIKITEATPSAVARGHVTVDGVNFACTATISVDVKPNKLAIARWLIKRGIIKSMRSVGGKLAQIGAVPMLFVEGGYRTLEAAYKNVKAGKDIPAFIDAANKNAQEAGRGFVKGALGGYGAIGARSGQVWAQKAYDVIRAEHPDMTQEEFRQALIAAPHWQEQAQASIAFQVKGAIYRGLKKADEWSVPHHKMVRVGLFGDAGPAPTGEDGLGVPLPEIVKLKPRTDIEFLDPLEVTTANVPPAVRAEAKHRVKNHTIRQSFEFDGTSYSFEFNRTRRTIFIKGGGAAQTIPYTPPWL